MTGITLDPNIIGAIEHLRGDHRPDHTGNYCALQSFEGCGMTWPCATEQLIREVERLGEIEQGSLREAREVSEMHRDPTDIPQGIEEHVETTAVIRPEPVTVRSNDAGLGFPVQWRVPAPKLAYSEPSEIPPYSAPAGETVEQEQARYRALEAEQLADVRSGMSAAEYLEKWGDE